MTIDCRTCNRRSCNHFDLETAKKIGNWKFIKRYRTYKDEGLYGFCDTCMHIFTTIDRYRKARKRKVTQ